MRTITQCKDEVAVKYGYTHWISLAEKTRANTSVYQAYYDEAWEMFKKQDAEIWKDVLEIIDTTGRGQGQLEILMEKFKITRKQHG